MSSARRLLMARPSPVPPYLRVVDESAWENDWNRRPIASCERPMPVSRTANVSSTRSSASGLRRDRDDHFACFGELHRVRKQVEDHLPQPRDVARNRRGHVALEEISDVEVLVDGARRDEVERRFDAVAQVERRDLDVHAACLDLREVEDVVDDGEQRIARLANGRRVIVLLGVERRVEQEPAHADHRVHRRADLVAHRGEEAALRFVRGFRGRARFLSLLEQPRVLDRDDRLVGERVEQRQLLVAEGLGRLSQHSDGADAAPFPEHRCPGHRNVTEDRHDAPHRGRRVGHGGGIGDMHRAPLVDDATGHRLADRLGERDARSHPAPSRATRMRAPGRRPGRERCRAAR